MSNILVVTPIYPGPDVGKNFTPVVHYFAREWVKAGYDVRVIHIPSYFPRPLYHLPQSLCGYFEAKMGSPFPKKRLDKRCSHELDGVKVCRLPLFRRFPKVRIQDSVLDAAADAAVAYLDGDGFTPDVVIGHWVDPSIYVVTKLKKHYGCPAVITLHEGDTRYYGHLVEDIDLWGYRCNRIKETFSSRHPQANVGFRCVSGIPKGFYANATVKASEKVEKYVYVGMLLERKYPDVLIKALEQTYPDGHFQLDIVGEGPMFGKLRSYVDRHGLTRSVRLHGRIPREQIVPILDDADVFVMISRAEVFGLVYLEAMARGCIAVAARGEGMDGIIENGVNGFLCEAGNISELCDIINHIKSLSVDERETISRNAYQTALQYSDENVALNYIHAVERGLAASQIGGGKCLVFKRIAISLAAAPAERRAA